VTPSPAGSVAFSPSGFLVGSTLGANFQAGAFVFGLEGDIDYSGVTTTMPAADGGGTFNSRWIATARGRAGYAIDRVLLYVTGGGAFANLQAPGVTTTGTGWTAGAGVEFALTQNWTAKAEYLFVDIPTRQLLRARPPNSPRAWRASASTTNSASSNGTNADQTTKPRAKARGICLLT